jgi:hypothetical protein
MKPPLFLLAGFFFLTNSGLHPLQPGAMRGDGTTELKKQGNFFGVAVYGGGS